MARFKELVTSQRPVDILSDYEYSQLYHEVDSAITAQEKEASQAAQAQAAAGPSTASLTQASLVAPGTATPSTTTATDETTADGSVGSSHEVASANGDVTPVGGEPNSGSVTEEAASSPAVANNEDTPDAADVAAATAAEDIAELKMLAEQEALAKVSHNVCYEIFNNFIRPIRVIGENERNWCPTFRYSPASSRTEANVYVCVLISFL